MLLTSSCCCLDVTNSTETASLDLASMLEEINLEDSGDLQEEAKGYVINATDITKQFVNKGKKYKLLKVARKDPSSISEDDYRNIKLVVDDKGNMKVPNLFRVKRKKKFPNYIRKNRQIYREDTKDLHPSHDSKSKSLDLGDRVAEESHVNSVYVTAAVKEHPRVTRFTPAPQSYTTPRGYFYTTKSSFVKVQFGQSTIAPSLHSTPSPVHHSTHHIPINVHSTTPSPVYSTTHAPSHSTTHAPSHSTTHAPIQSTTHSPASSIPQLIHHPPIPTISKAIQPIMSPTQIQSTRPHVHSLPQLHPHLPSTLAPVTVSHPASPHSSIPVPLHSSTHSSVHSSSSSSPIKQSSYPTIPLSTKIPIHHHSTLPHMLTTRQPSQESQGSVVVSSLPTKKKHVEKITKPLPQTIGSTTIKPSLFNPTKAYATTASSSPTTASPVVSSLPAVVSVSHLPANVAIGSRSHLDNLFRELEQGTFQSSSLYNEDRNIKLLGPIAVRATGPTSFEILSSYSPQHHGHKRDHSALFNQIISEKPKTTKRPSLHFEPLDNKKTSKPKFNPIPKIINNWKSHGVIKDKYEDRRWPRSQPTAKPTPRIDVNPRHSSHVRFEEDISSKEGKGLRSTFVRFPS